MNFYKRYPADYARKTARLSMVQHGAYCLLLDEVYTSEAPLPAAYDELFRICRAMSQAERTAVQIVADKFFPVGEDGLRRNKRAIEEIEEAAPAIEAARANGKLGGRPRNKTQKKPNGFLNGNPDETQDEPSSKPPQSSDSSTSLRSVEPRASRLPKPFELPQEWRDFCQADRPELDPDRTASKFSDYWHGRPGTGGKKLDWFATWRNWVRDERGPSKPMANKHTAAAAGIFGAGQPREVIDV